MGLQRNCVWYGTLGAIVALAMGACEHTPSPTTAPMTEPAAGLPPMRPDRLADATPQQEQFHLAAVEAYDRGDSNSAITALLALRDTQPYSELRAAGLLLLGELYYQNGSLEEAIALLVALRDQTPPRAALEYLLGRTLVAADRLVEAEDALRRAIRVDPLFLRSHIVLADMLEQAGRTEDAQAARLRFVREVQRIDAAFREPGQQDAQLQLVHELGRTVVDDTVARALATALTTSQDADVRGAAATALQRVGTPVAVNTLQAARASETDAARQVAIDAALAAIQTRFPPPPPRGGRPRR